MQGGDGGRGEGGAIEGVDRVRVRVRDRDRAVRREMREIPAGPAEA